MDPPENKKQSLNVFNYFVSLYSKVAENNSPQL